MKIPFLFILIIIVYKCSYVYGNSTIDIKECIYTILKSSVEQQCQKNGKYSNSIIENFDYYIRKIHKDFDNNEREKIGTLLKFLDIKEKDEWYFDKYIDIKNNPKFNNDDCSKDCSKKIILKYKELLDKLDEKDSEYIEINKQIKELEVCRNNNNYSNNNINNNRRNENSNNDNDNDNNNNINDDNDNINDDNENHDNENNDNDNNNNNKEEREENIEDDDTDCNIIEFGECALSVYVRNAESQCNNDGKCPDLLMDKLHKCFNKIKFGPTNDTAILDQPYYKSIQKIGLPFIFVCSKTETEWCYDKYRAAYNNSELMHEFVCSECGNVALSQYNSIFEKMSDLEDEEYTQILEHIYELNTCNDNDNNAIINTTLNITSLFIVNLIAIILISII